MLKNKICVLDDESSWVDLLHKWIKKVKIDADILSFTKHNDFLEKLHEIVTCDAIVIDYYLDGTTACQIIPLIRKLNREILIICCSGKFSDGNDFETMKKVLNSGATRVCPKNNDVFDLIFESHCKLKKLI
jgi:DNA-binding NtrC family response regulator